MIPAMTNPDPGKETRIVDVRGRNIVVRELVDAQLLLLGREARLAMNPATDQNRRLICVGRIFDILESVIVQEEDRDYILDLTVKGTLSLADMLGFISAFQEDEQKPRVRRGRASTKRS
jgi:hypothetical protein